MRDRGRGLDKWRCDRVEGAIEKPETFPALALCRIARTLFSTSLVESFFTMADVFMHQINQINGILISFGIPKEFTMYVNILTLVIILYVTYLFLFSSSGSSSSGFL